MKVVLADNAKFFPKHKQGYNGMASLVVRGSGFEPCKRQNVFVPAYAGLNLEHYFDEKSRERNVLFHPRHHPMVLARWKDANSAILSQDPFPPWNISYTSTFVVSGTNRIDFAIEITPRDKAIEQSKFLGVFWASYIQMPVQKGIAFLGHQVVEDAGKKRWIHVETRVHGEKSSIAPATPTYTPVFDSGFPSTWLFASNNEHVHDEPFFYGVNGRLAIVFMFKNQPGIWFAHSPSGGGHGCPAWDFYTIHPSPRLDDTFKIQGRLVAKPFSSPDDIVAEYAAFKDGT